MTEHPLSDPTFLAGVVEGFYGPPWSHAERLQLFESMSGLGLNTYLYAPKDDLKHRALWRETYWGAEIPAMRDLVQACQRRNVRFIFALSPGLDIRYSDSAELDRLRARFAQMRQLGVRHFALLFDDIPDAMRREDKKQWPTFAAAQCHVANTLFRELRKDNIATRMLFCPTAYCGRMHERGLGGPGYLDEIGRKLDRAINVLWTGPEIISREITVPHVRQISRILRRKPVLWDNLHANDYDSRRFFCGPYAGRHPKIRARLSGILANPNVEFPLNFVPLRTLAIYLKCSKWDSRLAYLVAIGDWTPQFETIHGHANEVELVSFADCFYLPHDHGPVATDLIKRARELLAVPQDKPLPSRKLADFRRQATALRDFCARLSELKNRPLFHALARRAWDLREELDLLLGYLDARQRDPANAFRSDFHLPGTFRGSFMTCFEELLEVRPDGTVTPIRK